MGNLKLVLTPVGAVQEFHPQAFSIIQFKWKEVTKFLCLFKTCATLKINQDFLKFGFSKLGASNLFQSLLVMFLKLTFKICPEIFLFFNLYIFIVHLLKSSNKSVLKSSFTLYWHIYYSLVIICLTYKVSLRLT